MSSLLGIITHYYYSLLRHYYVIITYQYVIITSLLRHYSSLLQVLLLPTITSLSRHYYVINTNSLLPIITSLLRHYYVIITSLLRHYYKWRKCVIMSSLLLINTFAVSIKISLLPIITIITYYYVFETEQLADAWLRIWLGLPRRRHAAARAPARRRPVPLAKSLFRVSHRHRRCFAGTVTVQAAAG